ncbi:ATP-dependent zinc protease [Algoriphagus lutimaris]|uniref:ATP-dependent zinc protease family protein n=1 Tax=Algoriphagus lutimaris TaxID=613197 RepID=UPI00196B4D8A|nr:RimK/LysX family protein [Algoriphagus lutimaris]MBN3522151.1 ATP-dependent zinc protease [Algoriphagus lutimaris]
MEKKVIGRKEKVSIPEFDLYLVWAKVDTGAYTSSIHAENIQVKEEDGKKVLTFQVLMPGHKSYTGKEIKVDRFREKSVKNSFGQAETRYLIQVTFQLAGEEYPAEFTLSDRSKMRNPILLGRKILKDKFLVDVSDYNLAKVYRQKTERK